MKDDLFNIDWEVFHFLRPDFLWLFIPLIIATLIVYFGIREEIKWAKVIAPHLRPYVIKKGSEKFKKVMQFMLFISIALAIVGVSGPTWEKYELPEKTLESPLVIALDLSQSMMAADIQPNRLERAKFKISDFIEADPKVRIALVGYAGTAHTIIPLTRDYTIIKSHITSLKPSIMPFPGSDLDAALKLTDSIIKVTSAPATLLLITDDFSENNFQQLQSFASKGDTKVYIMPMATPSGADVPNPRFRNRMLKDDTGNIVHSSLNMDVISKLKSIDNIKISTLTLDKTDMQLLATDIGSNLEFKEKQEDQDQDWEDNGMWLAIPLAFVILYWFRKGWVLFVFIGMIGFNSCNPEEKEQIDKEEVKQKFTDLWYTKDYQAQKEYDDGNYASAAENFEDPMHKGVAYYKYGDYDSAIKEFKKDSTANGKYNLGVAHYQNGDYNKAKLAFEEAIALNPNLPNASKSLEQTKIVLAEVSETNIDDNAMEAIDEGRAENTQNKGSEDFSGGGQEATEEDMKKERQEETTDTDVIKGEELDELPDDYDPNKQQVTSQKILLRKVDDDPALFTQKKFRHQVKKQKMKPKNTKIKW